ncbi:MAG: ornithine cyclodeaminase family protein [Acidobacteria bacterium]|nr:ornithine cyclodeaminase family protein [Acidobacteriota bacterium]
MAILLREADVEKLVTMEMAIATIEQAFRLQGEYKAENIPRRRCRLNKGMLHVMSASLPTLGYAGLKSYTSVSGKPCFYIMLYNADGTMVAVIEADKLGQMRTGAATVVATKHMARRESSRMGIIGTGWQARAQVQAVCAVGSFRNIVAWSRNSENRRKFCEEMTEATGVEVIPAETPEEAVKEKDIVITATNSKEPVLKGEWLTEGTHINAIGSNFLTRQELDVEAVRRCDCIIVDSSEQAMLESGDLSQAAEAEAFYWEDARELGLVVIGEYPGREDPSEITLFESQGIALEDIALAAKVYEKAEAEEIGEKLPIK